MDGRKNKGFAFQKFGAVWNQPAVVSNLLYDNHCLLLPSETGTFSYNTIRIITSAERAIYFVQLQTNGKTAGKIPALCIQNYQNQTIQYLA